MKTIPPTPNAFNINLHQRSQSDENLQSHQIVFSAPTSAWHSQVPSPESSPQSQHQARGQRHEVEMPPNNSAHDAIVDDGPVILKITPAEGPKAGGIEVTCLGEGFHQGLEVYFGDVAATKSSLYGDKAIVCLLPPSAQAGKVAVTIKDALHHSSTQHLQESIHFTYIGLDEQELIRHALQVLGQQFSGSSQAQEFAQKVLSSFQNTPTGDGGPPAPNEQHRQASSYPTDSFDSKDLESVVLKCLEIVDLDDNPNQVNLNLRGSTGQAMLHIGASLGYYRLVAGLLARGAHPDVRDDNGMTPLHMASLYGNVKIIRKLRSAGADPTIRSLNGVRPADIASTPRAQRTVEELGYHSRSRSSEATPVKHLSRTSSLQSSNPRRPELPQMSSMNAQCPRGLVGDRNEDPSYRHQSIPAFPPWSLPQSTSQPHRQHLNLKEPDDKLKSDAAAFAATPAMSAWRDQMSAQIQQIQQSLHRALPPIPNLPDYQAYPVMRRISNLVPQRGTRADHVDRDDDGSSKLKYMDYRWWELITGSSSSPPAYNEIYPPPTAQIVDGKKISAAYVDGEAVPEKKCDTLNNSPKSSSMIGTVNIGLSGLTNQQQHQIMIAHAHKIKKLRSDRKLFFVWVSHQLEIHEQSKLTAADTNTRVHCCDHAQRPGTSDLAICPSCLWVPKRSNPRRVDGFPLGHSVCAVIEINNY